MVEDHLLLEEGEEAVEGVGQHPQEAAGAEVPEEEGV